MRSLVGIIRCSWAILGSALAASSAYAAQLMILSKLDEIFGSGSDGVATYVGLVSFILAVPAFFFGSALIGLPTWFIATRWRTTGRLTAALIGAVQASIGGATVFIATMGVQAIILAIGLPVAGAVGGMTFRSLMANDAKPPPAPPS